MTKQLRQGFYGQGRICTVCEHSEYRHFPKCFEVDCTCDHFSARDISEGERRVQQAADADRANSDEWTGDPYTEFTKHLLDVMKK